MNTCLLEKHLTTSEHTVSTLTYEQPLNESLRLFLHLELLFNEFNKQMHTGSKNNILEAVQHLIRILYTIDRPDLKTKLTHTLTQLTSTLAQLQTFPQVDTLKLNRLLGELDKNIHYLLGKHSKIGDSLKHNELISQIKSNAIHPSGLCREKIPMFDLWFNQPLENITQQLNEWSSELQIVSEIVSQIITLTRNSSPFQPSEFQAGFYQHTFPDNTTCDLIRLSIPNNLQAYPEFSIGKHRIAIRLMQITEFNLRPHPYNKNIHASIALCRV
ncbi:MAG: cell division protein ZapD [Legionellales bacterium]|nr:cell division protein ZapD [Legionellales bacterium]